MQAQIKKLLDKVGPKQISQCVKKNVELYAYILSFDGVTISEKIYNCLNFHEPCPRGKERKFISLTKGYGYCGRTGVCECAREIISVKVKESKAALSGAQWIEINKKREKTSLERYGVTNNAQTDNAKKRHAEIYSDKDRVESIVRQVKQTKLDRYGNENYNNSSAIKNTLAKRFTSVYMAEMHNNSAYFILGDLEKIKNLYEAFIIPEISVMLGVHVQTVYRYLNLHGIRDKFKSSEEIEVVRFLDGIGITNIVCNSRSILRSGKELDIFLPDFNIAIEYNGVYWHHEGVPHITKTYHYDKFKECESLGIHLITIFSSVWKSKKDIVQRMLRNKLHMDSSSIYARKCVVKPVSTPDCRTFLNEYHIQGYTPVSVRVGLYNADVLCAIMTFSRPRSGIGKHRDNTYELVRFASSTRVVGGASKLLADFLKTHECETIISYSDNSWSDGNLYRVLGFELEKEQKPSYWYVLPHEEKMRHRYNFAKYKLIERGYDVNKTEATIMRELGCLRVWDCGTRTWCLSVI